MLNKTVATFYNFQSFFLFSIISSISLFASSSMAWSPPSTSSASLLSSREVKIIATRTEDLGAIKSAVNHGLEVYRKDLAATVYRLESALSEVEGLAALQGGLDVVQKEWLRMKRDIPLLHERNEEAADQLLRNPPQFQLALSNLSSWSHFPFPFEAESVSSSSYGSVQQLLIHLSRDWGDVGHRTRKETYIDGILQTLQKTLDQMDDSSFLNRETALNVLVPGAGMGRLAMEIAAAGNYRVEANEVSGIMVLAMHSILTEVLPEYLDKKETREIYPFIHSDFADEWDFAVRVMPSVFPSADAECILKWMRERQKQYHSSFRIQYGDFLSVYGENSRSRTFDVIVTCFFIDTFVSIVEPLLVIHHILKPGGIWINAGPLHYHGKSKIPCSYRQLDQIVHSFGFSKVSEEAIESYYLGEGKMFMKPQVYNFPLTAWKKNIPDDKNSRDLLQRYHQGIHAGSITRNESETRFIMK